MSEFSEMTEQDLLEIGETIDKSWDIDCSSEFTDAMGAEVASHVEELRGAALQLLTHLKEINTLQTKDFTKAVENEVAHQSSRWGDDHDREKTAEDWFWLLGWLLGKAAREPAKRLHHIITSAAALAQWHRRAAEEEIKKAAKEE